jgi:hypothetical protein
VNSLSSVVRQFAESLCDSGRIRQRDIEQAMTAGSATLAALYLRGILLPNPVEPRVDIHSNSNECTKRRNRRQPR